MQYQQHNISAPPSAVPLNKEQQQAVSHYKGPLMILAGAGTGKTRVITARIAHMMAQGVPAEKIVAMTFTNKAAREMLARIQHMVGGPRSRKLWVSTFHRFCLQNLRRFAEQANLPPSFALINTYDQLDFIKRILEEKAVLSSLKPEAWLFKISLCKNILLKPEDLKKGEHEKLSIFDDLSSMETFIQIYDLYERTLRLNRSIDFDDCITKFVYLLRDHPEIKKRLQETYQYILVDEFQDTNHSQFVVLSELAEDHRNICVVGDDDQSIYSWRGAMFETLEKFEKVFPESRLIMLEQNYRSCPGILSLANTLIRHNQKRKDKTLWSGKVRSAPPTVCGCHNAKDEATFIAETCLSLLGQNYKPSDIAILYRTNPQAKLLEMAIQECRLPFKTFGGPSFFERREVKDFLSYVRLILDPEDHVALWRIINTPPRGIGIKTKEEIDERARRLNLSPFDGLKKMAATQYSASICDFVQKTTDLMRRPLQDPKDLSQLGMLVIQNFELASYLRKMTPDEDKFSAKMEHLRSMPAWLESVGERVLQEAREEGREAVLSWEIRKVLDQINLDHDDFPGAQEKEDQKVQAISLMTIHASKGLEFPVVLIAGVEEELLPHKNSMSTVLALSEERRLFYVAITRAKEKLFMTYARERQNGFQKLVKKKSRFLAELGSADLACIDRTGLELTSKEERKEKTLQKLSDIRKALELH
ncbi:MAG: UvrD-helicase domain-containing protein [Oligoflexales bacterium]|nr:UvrD-helicase domain-containing protein [Oligoflexales bacterium]